MKTGQFKTILHKGQKGHHVILESHSPDFLGLILVGGLVGPDGEIDGMFYWFDWVRCFRCFRTIMVELEICMM